MLVTLVILSIAVQGYSFDTLNQARDYNAKLNEWVEETGNYPSLSTLWWLPGDVSTVSNYRPWFLTPSEKAITVVSSGLRTQGYSQLYVYERPPYTDTDFWWEVGLELERIDYYIEGDGRLKRSKLRIIQ